MDIIKEIENYALSKPVVEMQKDGKHTTHFKINGKTFLVISNEHYPHLFLKNEPIINALLRKRFDFIFPSYIYNKVYWNTIILNKDLKIETYKKMIDVSYDISIKKMNKKQKFYYEYISSESA